MHPEKPHQPEHPELPESPQHPDSLHDSGSDPELEWSPELARFARQLAKRTPVASGIDPAVPFYQAGYAAGMANQAAVDQAAVDQAAVEQANADRVTADRVAANKRQWGSLGLVASWLLLLGLGTAAGYLASWRHHGALLMAADQELRALRQEQQVVRTGDKQPVGRQTESPGSDMARRGERPGGAEQHGIGDNNKSSDDDPQLGTGRSAPSHAPSSPRSPGHPNRPDNRINPTPENLAQETSSSTGRRSASGWDEGTNWIGSRLLSWIPGMEERASGNRSHQEGWRLAHGRSAWTESVMAQIHDPSSLIASSQFIGMPPGDRTGKAVGRPESDLRPSRQYRGEWTQPTSLREVVERRTQFVESFLQ